MLSIRQLHREMIVALLTDEALVAKFDSPNPAARQAALRCLSAARSRHPGACAAARAAADRYPADPYDRFDHLSNLVHDAECARWMLDRLAADPQRHLEDWRHPFYASGLALFDIAALRPFQAELFERLRDRQDALQKLTSRFRLASFAADECRAELAALLDGDSVDEAFAGKVTDLAEALATDPEIARQATDWLPRDPRTPLNNAEYKRAYVAALLAGHRRDEGAVPGLLNFLAQDEDYSNEVSSEALGLIGGEAVVAAVAERVARQDGDRNLTYVAALLGDLRLPSAVAQLAAWTAGPLEDKDREWVAVQLAGQPDPEACAIAHRAWLKLSKPRELALALSGAAELLDIPLPDVKAELEAYRIERAIRSQPAPLQPIAPVYLVPRPAKAEAGRNNPCPCRSGKKFKKCCGKN
jgi:hypothetical protein